MRYSKLLVFHFLLATQCVSPKPKSDKVSFLPGFSYDKMTKINLSGELEEISGLEWQETGKLWAIEDESSIIYELEPSNGKVIRKKKFAKNADIEDLLTLNGTAWVLESNGTLYQVTDPLTAEAKTTIYPFPLKGKRDMEAIVVLDSSLLVFCKVCSWDEGSDRASVFRFDLASMSYDSLPTLVLQKEEILPLLGNFSSKNLKIQPSAAAFHPIDKKLYIISSSGKWLLTMNPLLQPQAVVRLDPVLFKQPEGITFDQNGTMYISNEAQDGQANILIFPYDPEGLHEENN